jgi:hypothetical protein
MLKNINIYVGCGQFYLTPTILNWHFYLKVSDLTVIL